MSDAYVRTTWVEPAPPPDSNVGLKGWIRASLFASPGDALLTIVGFLILVWAVPPLFNFLIGNAVFVANDGAACRVDGAGACWAYIWDRMNFFIYGFYPQDQQWRVNICFVVGALLITPLLVPTAPYKRVNAVLFFAIYPIMVLILLRGGMFGLSFVPTENWGGLTVTLIIGLCGIVISLPIGVVLALGRQSHLPVIRSLSIAFIELWRSAPLITILFMASVMLPLFAPQGVTVDKLVRAIVGVTLFEAAYLAEAVRGGLQALPRGQYEAADSLGLNYPKAMGLIILPQALKLSIPGIVNSFISLFKDTSLVSIVGIFDLLNTVQSSTSDLRWGSPHQAVTGYLFAAFVFWTFCFGMSRYSLFIERRLDTGHKR
jgi:general L-amino acid transport system permease protein